jgi:pimeloyl-ACP methyl ester carboxylesterase
MNSADWYKEGTTEVINDLEVFFKRSGKGQVLLCVHGFPSSSWDFESIWPSLTERFDVIAHDLIGLGKSAKPNQPLTIRLQADMIEGLLIRLGINEAHLFAHDLGDTIAQELLARQFEKSSKINWLSCVFMNGGIFPETHRALFIQKLLLSPLGPLVVKLMSEKSMKKSLTKIFSKAHPPTNEFVHETWKLTSENKGLSMLPKLIHYINERRTYRERWVRPLENAVIPIRLINGIEDPISGKHAADRFAEVVPNADIVLLGNSGHYPHLETPKEVLKAFFEFHNALGQDSVNHRI